MKRLFLSLMVPILSIVLTLLAIEGATRIYFSLRGLHNTEAFDFRLSRPAPYQNSPYFSHELIYEQWDRGGMFFTPPGTRLILPRNVVGHFISNQNNLRVTTDQPAVFRKRVLLFGGSTQYCGEVADPFTIASILQRLLNQRFPGEYSVFNYGVTSVTSSQELERLKTLNLAPTDTVIFYDGINDILQGIYLNNPTGTIVGTQAASRVQLTPFQKFMHSLETNGWLQYSSFINDAILSSSSFKIPLHLQDKNQVQAASEIVGKQFLNVIREASGWTLSRKARFWHFLQPNLFSISRASHYERDLERTFRVVPAGMKEAFLAGNAVLSEIVKGLAAESIQSQSLLTSFDDRAGQQELFLDSMHVTETGNRIIAHQILDRVFPRSKESTLHGSYLPEEEVVIWRTYLETREKLNPKGSELPQDVIPKDEQPAISPSWTLSPEAARKGQQILLGKGGYLKKTIQFHKATRLFVDLDCPGGPRAALTLRVIWVDSAGKDILPGSVETLDCAGRGSPLQADFIAPKGTQKMGIVVENQYSPKQITVTKIWAKELATVGSL